MNRLIRTLLAAVCLTALSGSAAVAAPAGQDGPDGGTGDTLVLPGDDFYPESIIAGPDGTLYVSSLVTGEIVRFRPGSRTAETFVPADVNVGTGGVLVDGARGVLWACAVDLTYSTPFMLRAFDLRDGDLLASYTIPDRGICADITLARGDVYVADASNPTLIPYRPARLLRLSTPNPLRPTRGTLSPWSADPALTGPNAALQIDGIAFDGRSSIYTTNNDTGQLLRVDIAADGSARTPVEIVPGRRLVAPDGIRMVGPTRLLVTELGTSSLLLVDVAERTTTVVAEGLNDPTSVAVTTARGTWVAEGQVMSLLRGEPPAPPFTIRRV